jgi:hypothetical protein
LRRNAPQFQQSISGGTTAPTPWPDVLSIPFCCPEENRQALERL